MTNTYSIKTAFCDGELVHYRLFYKNNRNFYMRLGENNLINVIVPSFASIEQIEKFVNSNIKKMSQYSKNVQNNDMLDFDKNVICIYDTKYSIKCIVSPKRQKYELINQVYYLHLKNLDQKLVLIKKIYHDSCNDYLVKRTVELLQKFNLSANLVNTKWLTSKWGYCNYHQKSITLALQLAAYDYGVIDYVIIHEIMHLIEPNHSPNFWNLVELKLPNYKILRNKLRNFSESM